MNLTLKIWRQKNNSDKGGFKEYKVTDISKDMSFLEMLDVLNEQLTNKGEDPVHFDHDCREGICGMCSLYINGNPHGPQQTTTCQLHMRSFNDGETITIEPWRAKAFPVIKDLVTAQCIGCGACVAACKNASAMLFTSAKVSQLALLPQGQVERKTRAEKMVAQMDAEGFGACTNTGACEAECPKGISITNIARMNREYFSAVLSSENV